MILDNKSIRYIIGGDMNAAPPGGRDGSKKNPTTTHTETCTTHTHTQGMYTYILHIPGPPGLRELTQKPWPSATEIPAPTPYSPSILESVVAAGAAGDRKNN
jgi:hypothetical protein